MLVIREFFAIQSARVTAFRTALAGGAGELTLTGAEGCRQLAAIRAIDARVHCLCVILVSLGDQLAAVLEAHVALKLAIRTRLGTFHKVLVVRIVGRGKIRAC
jgi:hypothetical protein